VSTGVFWFGGAFQSIDCRKSKFIPAGPWGNFFTNLRSGYWFAISAAGFAGVIWRNKCQLEFTKPDPGPGKGNNMFAKLLRTCGIAAGVGSLALLAGCSACHTAASASAGTRTVTIGQGGSYIIPDQFPSDANAPYALTGSQETGTPDDLVGVHQNYGQSQVIIPPPRY
jgi:hypothetical protein